MIRTCDYAVVKLLMPSFSASVPLDEALATTAGSYGIIVFKIDEDFVSHHYITSGCRASVCAACAAVVRRKGAKQKAQA